MATHKVDTTYAFTWSPKETTKSIPWAYDYFINTYFKKIGFHKCWISISIYPELNVNGNLHFHGTLYELKDKFKWYHKVLPKLKHNGFVCIKPCGNLQQWIEYIRKDVVVMQKILKQYTLPYHGDHEPIPEKEKYNFILHVNDDSDDDI